VEEIEIALEEGAAIGAEAGTRIRATPATHGRDTVAVRFDAAGASVCHSSDTTPSAAVAHLARGADMLFHDCAGPHRSRDAFSTSHSSAHEAAEVAADAGVGALVLMHLGAVDDAVLEECVREAERGFSGAVILAHDGATWTLTSTPQQR
jgi:ribonuclease BN (tRNA processing enzyme)